jgi:hypothetical protein
MTVIVGLIVLVQKEYLFCMLQHTFQYVVEKIKPPEGGC